MKLDKQVDFLAEGKGAGTKGGRSSDAVIIVVSRVTFYQFATGVGTCYIELISTSEREDPRW